MLRYLNTKIYSYLETSGGQSSNLYLKVVHFFAMPMLIRHLWQLKTIVFLHWCQIYAALLSLFNFYLEMSLSKLASFMLKPTFATWLTLCLEQAQGPIL